MAVYIKLIRLIKYKDFNQNASPSITNRCKDSYGG